MIDLKQLEVARAAMSLGTVQHRNEPRSTVINAPKNLNEINLEEEILLAYAKVKDLLDTTLLDEITPANQKAQVVNSLTGTLGQVIKMQIDLRREEKFKLMESLLIEALKTLPEQQRNEFFVEYERLAGKSGLM